MRKNFKFNLGTETLTTSATRSLPCLERAAEGRQDSGPRPNQAQQQVGLPPWRGSLDQGSLCYKMQLEVW